MILTCPECATSYFVDETKIPTEGRLVKCAACGARWTAYNEVEAEPAPEEAPVAAEVEAPEEVETADLAEPESEDLPKAFRARQAEERKVREAATNGVVWAAMAGVLALLIAVAAVFRIEVVHLWPKTAQAYAWAGLPVNSLGLVIEGVRVEPSLQEGHAALSVSGMIRNVKEEAITAPPLRVSLINKAGKRVTTKIAQPADALVPPGETRHFALAILDPPTTARELEVAFAPEAARKGLIIPKAARAAAPAPAPAAALRGASDAIMPAPLDAAPLPQGSPYSLSPPTGAPHG
jgi:predicted Zn finger-like uncharacterized protein